MDLISSDEITNDFRKEILLHFKRACENDITIEWFQTATTPLNSPHYFRYKLTALLCLTLYPNPETLDVLRLLKSLQLDLVRLGVKRKDPGYLVTKTGLHPNSYTTLVEILNNTLNELSNGEKRFYDKKVVFY